MVFFWLYLCVSHPFELIAMLRDIVDPRAASADLVQHTPAVPYRMPHSFAQQVVEIVDTVELALACDSDLHGTRPAPVQLLHGCTHY